MPGDFDLTTKMPDTSLITGQASTDDDDLVVNAEALLSDFRAHWGNGPFVSDTEREYCQRALGHTDDLVAKGRALKESLSAIGPGWSATGRKAAIMASSLPGIILSANRLGDGKPEATDIGLASISLTMVKLMLCVMGESNPSYQASSVAKLDLLAKRRASLLRRIDHEYNTIADNTIARLEHVKQELLNNPTLETVTSLKQQVLELVANFNYAKTCWISVHANSRIDPSFIPNNDIQRSDVDQKCAEINTAITAYSNAVRALDDDSDDEEEEFYDARSSFDDDEPAEVEVTDTETASPEPTEAAAVSTRIEGIPPIPSVPFFSVRHWLGSTWLGRTAVAVTDTVAAWLPAWPTAPEAEQPTTPEVPYWNSWDNYFHTIRAYVFACRSYVFANIAHISSSKLEEVQMLMALALDGINPDSENFESLDPLDIILELLNITPDYLADHIPGAMRMLNEFVLTRGTRDNRDFNANWEQLRADFYLKDETHTPFPVFRQNAGAGATLADFRSTRPDDTSLRASMADLVEIRGLERLNAFGNFKRFVNWLCLKVGLPPKFKLQEPASTTEAATSSSADILKTIAEQTRDGLISDTVAFKAGRSLVPKGQGSEAETSTDAEITGRAMAIHSTSRNLFTRGRCPQAKYRKALAEHLPQAPRVQ